VQSGGSQQKGAGSQLWGIGYVIRGSGSQTRGAGSGIRGIPQIKPLVSPWGSTLKMCGVSGDTSPTSPLQGHLTVLKVRPTVCHTAGHYGKEYDATIKSE